MKPRSNQIAIPIARLSISRFKDKVAARDTGEHYQDKPSPSPQAGSFGKANESRYDLEWY